MRTWAHTDEEKGIILSLPVLANHVVLTETWQLGLTAHIKNSATCTAVGLAMRKVSDSFGGSSCCDPVWIYFTVINQNYFKNNDPCWYHLFKKDFRFLTEIWYGTVYCLFFINEI